MQTQYIVAVRTLCEFTAKAGDLDQRFTPSPSAQEGIAGHLLVGASRGAHYQTEITLCGSYRHLQVRGRADGYDAAANRLEEIKTHRGDLARMPDNHRQLHWAQVRIYGWLLCSKLALAEVELALVYFDIASQQETVLTERASAAALRDYFERQCERFLAWAERELAHRAARDAALAALRFPHAAYRPGQRELATAVYRGLAQNRCLLAQAPTGIGKTLGTLFPALKACAPQALDKVFFLAARNAGRRMALDALDLLAAEAPLPLRVLELVAREKSCEHPDKACHGESCPLAKGFYDRLPAARDAVIAGPLHQGAVRTAALAHDICPYYLAQDLARWADVVVGDYNYYFDASAMLYALAQANQWRVAVLVDEAHNLVERGRDMYTASLDQRDLAALRRAGGPLKKPLDRLQRRWRALLDTPGVPAPYQARDAVPETFVAALQQAVAAIADHLVAYPAAPDAALQRFYFDALQFMRLQESFGPHALFDTSRDEGGSVLCIRNVVPARYLAPRFAAARSVTLFSATLSPWQFYAGTLGLPADTPCIDVASPFDAGQLTVHLVNTISTRFRHRDASLAPIADLIARQFDAQPGNYLAFFSSFDYLDKALALFAARHPGIPCWQQSRRMDAQARDAFLGRFAAGGRGVGFAVLGGAFAEGIDLPGKRLIGAFIATLGLPQVNPVNEEMRRRMEASFGNGYDYTYLYPGLRKVVQAAGRVIRGEADQGTLYLIDDRFARPSVRALLPGWWAIQGNACHTANPRADL